ncbi:MAG: ArsR family transcriptional regulator [Hyphomicrobiales bacterium]|nr:ArsR family transcriptional regulator [Hyphomicrobiales bacterium]
MKTERKPKLDAFDVRVLKELQSDASQPLEELAGKVGLSPTATWRRVQKLEQSGAIRKRVAILDRELMNVGVTVFIAIRTNQHSAEWLEKFSSAVNSIAEIVDFYRMSGQIDYLLKAHVSDLKSYDALYKKLIARVELTDVTSMFAIEELKSTTEIPLNFVELS